MPIRSATITVVRGSSDTLRLSASGASPADTP
jgi:hypothetical protein